MKNIVIYSPYKTQIIFFDLEFFVPKKDRKSTVFCANPYSDEHFLIGGSFHRYFPLNDMQKKENFKEFWIWEYPSEKAMLEEIIQLFETCWSKIRQNPAQAELFVCGIGIARVDIGYLFARCHFHKVRSDEALFTLFYHLRILDFEMIVIPYFKNKDSMLKPKSTKDILAKFKIERERGSGTDIWPQYDNKEYEKIRERNVHEVEDLLAMYTKIVNKIHTDHIPPKFRTEHLEERIAKCKSEDDKTFIRECYPTYNQGEERWNVREHLNDDEKLRLYALLMK